MRRRISRGGGENEGERGETSVQMEAVKKAKRKRTEVVINCWTL